MFKIQGLAGVGGGALRIVKSAMRSLKLGEENGAISIIVDGFLKGKRIVTLAN